MGWLIEMLIEGIQEKCSQFIIDMMEVITEMFTELLSCDLNLFEELFSVVGALYKSAVVPLSIALLLLILTWQLFKSMFGKLGLSSEDPVELVFRSGACLFLIVGAKSFVNYVLAIAGTPYQWIVGSDIKVNSFSEYVSSVEGVTAVLGIDSISTLLLTMIMQFVVAWNYFKMLFMVAERYVLLGVFSYTAPLAFATGGSKSTNNILSSWAKMFGGQIVLIIMNAWCMKMFLSGYGNMLASGYGFTKFFVATLCLVGFCKITFKLDTYMASLGVNLGRPSGGMGAMGVAMAASRIFSSLRGYASYSEQPSGGSIGDDPAGAGGQYGSQDMANGFTQPIPMSPEERTESGASGQEHTETANAVVEEAAVSGTDMYESDNESVLEVLGEMPAGTGGTGAADNPENGESYGSDTGKPSDDASQMEEILETGSGRIAAGDDIGNYPDADVSAGSQNEQNENSEESIIEILNQGNSIDGAGDYPVRRRHETDDAVDEIPLEMDNAVIGAPVGTEETANGSAAPAYEHMLPGRQSAGEAEQAGQAKAPDVIQELGALPSLDIPVNNGSAAAEFVSGSIESSGDSDDVSLNMERNLDSTGLTQESVAEGIEFGNAKGSGSDSAGSGDSGSASMGILKGDGEEGLTAGVDAEGNVPELNIMQPVPETAPFSFEPEETGPASGMSAGSENGYRGVQEQEDYENIQDGADFLTGTGKHDEKGFGDADSQTEDVPEACDGADGLRVGRMDDEEKFPV